MQKVIEEQCAMCYSNLFVSVDALERGGDGRGSLAFFSMLRDIGSSQQKSL